MLNDIKFLYYLLTNYTLKEIKTLFEIAHLVLMTFYNCQNSKITNNQLCKNVRH